MLPAPFRVPFRAERAVDVLLFGGGLHLANVYLPVLPLVVVLGYHLRVLTELAGRDDRTRFDSLPGFGDPLELLRRGAGAAVVVVAALLPATVVLVVTVAGFTNRPLSPGSIDFGTSVAFLLGSTAALLLGVGFLYLLPAALVSYGVRGRLRAAVDTEALRQAGTDASYFYNVAAGLVVGAFLLAVANALVGIAVGFFVAFYAEVVMVAFWSRGVDGLVATFETPASEQGAPTAEG